MPAEIEAFQAFLNTELKSFLEREMANYAKISPHTEVIGILSHLEAVAAGGKRLRPYLTWSIYKQAHPEAALEEIKDLLLAIELFHVFCLIHDDIMDEAEFRHGTKTIHTKALSDLYKNNSKTGRRIAENQAILAGDILFNSVFKLLLSHSQKQPQTSKQLMEVFHNLIDEVCIGQMIDVHLTSKASVTVEEVVDKNRLKTAYYSFVRPLHLGTIAAGREDLTDFVIKFGEQLGLLYQIQDDLLDIIGDTKNTQKPLFQDVSQNQHTVLSAFIRNQSGDHKEILDKFSGQSLSKEDEGQLTEVFINSGAITEANRMIEEHEKAAFDLISTSSLTTEERLLFSSMINLIIKRKK